MRALISVYDKTGVVEFARGLVDLGFELVSSGGTASALEQAGLAVTTVEDVTGFPEMLGGRVKTLHPNVHAGILARRELEEDLAALAEHDIDLFDLVCVNLYPFELAVDRPELDESDVIEMIDIGGPALLRAAAKSFASVIAVCRPSDYEPVLEQLWSGRGATTLELRRHLASIAFARTAAYDSAIARWFQRGGDFPGDIRPVVRPRARAPVRREPAPGGGLLRGARRSHASPCVRRPAPGEGALVQQPQRSLRGAPADVRARGAGVRDREAREPVRGRCRRDDRGGVREGARGRSASPRTGASSSSTARSARRSPRRWQSQFVEVLFAPGYEAPALEALARKQSLRVLVHAEQRGVDEGERDYRRVLGGLLVQERDSGVADRAEMQVVCGELSDAQWDDLVFAWRVVKHVASNAIVLARGGQTLGIGAGQMSRVDAVRIAVEKARELGHSLEGAVLASDAFFPFADGPQLALDSGVVALIQPGGSKRDAEVIDAVSAVGAAMVFTGRRHFRH